MDIEEMQRKKRAAESKIMDVMNSFEEATGLYIYNIKFDRGNICSPNRNSYVYNVEMEVRL